MMVFGVGITSDDARAVAIQSAGGGVRARETRACLVLSGNQRLRRRLEAVADLGGWDRCESPTDIESLHSAVDGDFQFVVIDIAHPVGARVSDSAEMAEEFAGRQGCNVVILGCEESTEEELWARQLGVWAYLPGVCSGDSLVALFTDARRMIERRTHVEVV